MKKPRRWMQEGAKYLQKWELRRHQEPHRERKTNIENEINSKSFNSIDSLSRDAHNTTNLLHPINNAKYEWGNIGIVCKQSAHRWSFQFSTLFSTFSLGVGGGEERSSVCKIWPFLDYLCRIKWLFNLLFCPFWGHFVLYGISWFILGRKEKNQNCLRFDK